MNARSLFTVAAIFNALVGLGIFLAYDLLAPWLGFPPRPTVWLHIVALTVLAFGYAYWRQGIDHDQEDRDRVWRHRHCGQRMCG